MGPQEDYLGALNQAQGPLCPHTEPEMYGGLYPHSLRTLLDSGLDLAFISELRDWSTINHYKPSKGRIWHFVELLTVEPWQVPG